MLIPQSVITEQQQSNLRLLAEQINQLSYSYSQLILYIKKYEN